MDSTSKRLEIAHVCLYRAGGNSEVRLLDSNTGPVEIVVGDDVIRVEVIFQRKTDTPERVEGERNLDYDTVG